MFNLVNKIVFSLSLLSLQFLQFSPIQTPFHNCSWTALWYIWLSSFTFHKWPHSLGTTLYKHIHHNLIFFFFTSAKKSHKPFGPWWVVPQVCHGGKLWFRLCFLSQGCICLEDSVWSLIQRLSDTQVMGSIGRHQLVKSSTISVIPLKWSPNPVESWDVKAVKTAWHCSGVTLRRAVSATPNPRIYLSMCCTWK